MLRILIVEDDHIFAKELAYQLQLNQCEVIAIADTAEQAILDIDKHEPHLLFIDIQLAGIKDGIAVAEYINEKCRVPFIYLSEHFSKNSPYFKRATATIPANYLPKGGFLPSHVWHFVDMALHNFSQAGGFFINQNESNIMIRNCIFVKTGAGNIYEKMDTGEITHLEYNKPYTDVFRADATKKSIVRVRKSIDFAVVQLNGVNLVRINKSMAINMALVDRYDKSNAIIYLNTGLEFDLGRVYKDNFERALGMFN
jgi:CheY-like chemotaxis protein